MDLNAAMQFLPSSTLSRRTPATTPGSTATRFGCRLFAHMTAQPYAGQDEFIRQCLLDGDNALRKQAIPHAREAVDGDLLGWEQMAAGHRDVASGQEDGWGMAVFDAHGPRIQKSRNIAHQDPAFQRAAQALAQRQPELLLAHLRKGDIRRDENAHPFQLGKLAFMHNGTIPPLTVRQLEQDGLRYHQQYQIPLPNGNTDTERAFLSMMGRLREEHGTLDPDQLTTDQLYRSFRHTLQYIRNTAEQIDSSRSLSVQQGLGKIAGLSVHPDSETRFPYALNFILSDGARLLASRVGFKLYLGIRKDAQGKAQDVVLATRRMQPDAQSAQPRITWWEIPDRHTLCLERENGKIRLRLDPLPER